VIPPTHEPTLRGAVTRVIRVNQRPCSIQSERRAPLSFDNRRNVKASRAWEQSVTQSRGSRRPPPKRYPKLIIELGDDMPGLLMRVERSTGALRVG
jgi:hypothetical protein